MPTRILFANEPRAYREVMAAAVRVLRPCVEAIALPPEDLDRELARLRPELVVCSQLTAAVAAGAPTWVLLHQDGEPGAVVSARGERTTVASADFDDLLALVDRVSGGSAGGGRAGGGVLGESTGG